MKKELEEMVETYKRLTETESMTPSERVYVAKKRRDLWWEIRQRSREFPFAIQQKIYRSAHPEKVLEQWHRQRDRLRKLKAEVLTYYGNGKLACVRCSFDNVWALSIDHINGGGSRQRNENKLRSSSSFYAWLKKRGFPTGYQTLCMNCNWIKRFERGEHNAYMEYSVEPIDWQK